MAELPFDVTDARLAAAAWSRIAEPGDTDAGALLAHLGPVEALGWLVHAAAGSGQAAVGGGRAGRPGVERAVGRWAPRLEGLDIRRELDRLAALGGRLVVRGDEEWPGGLDDLGHRAPVALWVRGAASLGLLARAVALVGARASTSYGEHVAVQAAMGLGERGVSVVSGGAYGIDAAAHRGALAVEAPTVAILAGGVDRLYPTGNTALLEQVLASGAVVAEVPPGSVPMRSRFLERNRLIAAGSRACVVVEAAWRSGALSTAAHAAALLRPVGAVPGPVTSMASAGCHRLLRETDAVCVTDAAEILELVGPIGAALAPEPEVARGLLDGLDPVCARVLDALPARGAAPAPNVVRASGLSPGEVRSALGRLELAGRVERNGGAWRRSRPAPRHPTLS
ncbi:DNA-processing protein DprA [Georgenia faecalis]|uniref:DNA-processing protein DprA n=1 Tax=Georgenia faecalis TaxID=2483799 RepID=A0ABV9DCX7_9MICO|nr:DNA-processing protein DprA [Georgenia faecalis]